MGWPDVYVLEGGIGNLPLTRDPFPSQVPGFDKRVSVDPQKLQQLLKAEEDFVVLDLASSAFFKKNHISPAWWGIRSRIPADLHRLPSFKTLILTSEGGILAHLAATDLKHLKPELKVIVLEGGTNAWIEAGLPTSGGMENAISADDDTWYMPYMFPDAPEQAKREYLEWELALVAQVERDGTARFRKF
jgi:rhodanese-related sulfurtransferase